MVGGGTDPFRHRLPDIPPKCDDSRGLCPTPSVGLLLGNDLVAAVGADGLLKSKSGLLSPATHNTDYRTKLCIMIRLLLLRIMLLFRHKSIDLWAKLP